MLTDTFSFKKLFSDTGEIIKRYYKYALLFVLIIFIPLTCLRVFVIDARFDYFGNYSRLMDILDRYQNTQDLSEQTEAGDIASKITAYMIIQALFSAIALMCDIAAMLGVKAFYEGKEIGANEILEKVPKLFPKLFLTRLLADIFISLGLMMCFIPGILMYFVLFFVNQSVVIDGFGGMKGLFVSSIYQRNNKKSSALITIFYLLYTLAVSFIFSFIPAFFEQGTAGYMASDIIASIIIKALGLFGVIAVSAFYVNAKPEFDFSVLNKKKSANQ